MVGFCQYVSKFPLNPQVPLPSPQVPLPSSTQYGMVSQYGSQTQAAMAPFHGQLSSQPLMPGLLSFAPQNEQQQQQQQAQALNYLLQTSPHQLQQLAAQQLQPHHPVGLRAGSVAHQLSSEPHLLWLASAL